MAQPITLPMTPTCAAVIRHYAGDPLPARTMRLDVFQKAVTRCTRAGWLEDIDAWPYTGATATGRQAIEGW